jgi:hypothetical protein
MGLPEIRHVRLKTSRIAPPDRLRQVPPGFDYVVYNGVL